MTVRVAAAFLASGFLKAGTPSAMASMPVRATAPEEKPRSRRKRPMLPPVSIPSNSAGDGGGTRAELSPKYSRHRP